MSIWKTPDHTPKRELDIDQAAAVEECLETARAWADGEITTGQALTIALDVPRAIGLAFQHRWSDPRRPALERLHAIEYGQRYDMTYTNFGWLPTAQFEQVCRNNEYRRQHDADWAA